MPVTIIVLCIQEADLSGGPTVQAHCPALLREGICTSLCVLSSIIYCARSMVDNMISPSGMYYKPKHCKMFTSIPTNQIHDDIVKIFSTEQDRRTTFMDSISTKPCVRFVN